MQPSSNPPFAFPDQLVVDPATGQIAVWSSGDPLLDGAYLAAELALGLIFPLYIAGEGSGLFIGDPAPRVVD